MKKLEKITAGQDFERWLYFSAGDLPENQVLVSRQLLFESEVTRLFIILISFQDPVVR